MLNFRFVQHVHTPALGSAVFRQRAAFDKDTRRQKLSGSPHHATKSIVFRGPKDPDEHNWFEDVPSVDYGLLNQAEWKAAKNTLLHIRRAVQGDIDRLQPGRQLGAGGKAMLVQLAPGGHVDWHVDSGEYARKHWRFHLPLVTNPGAVMYAGGEMVHMPVGALFLFNNLVKHSAVNFGAHPRTHLIVDFRQPEDV